MMGAVSSGWIRRPGRGAGVPARSPCARVPPERNSLSPSTSFLRPFSAAPVAVASLVLGPGQLSLGLELDSLVPRSSPSSWWQSSARPSPIVYLRCPITCLQLDSFSISLNVPSSVVCRMPRPGLLLGSLLPAWYQFWSFRAAPPSQFKRGRRTDLSPRGRVPPIPEVPGRALTPDFSKRLHIHAVPSSSMPAWPFLYTPPGDPHAPL